MACLTSKAVYPADEARALMNLKRNHYINRQERPTQHDKAQHPIYLFTELYSFLNG